MVAHCSNIVRPLAAESATRRALLRRLGGGGLVAAAGLGLVPDLVAAQGTPAASPATMSFLESWFAAFNAHHLTRALAFYTDDAVAEDLAFGLTVRGQAQLQSFFAGFFKVVPDVHFELRGGFQSGEMVAAEWVQSGTDHGLVPNVPATGKRFAVRGASILQLAGGKIAHEADYYNLVTILQQLGLMAGGGTPPAGTPAP